MAKRSRRVLDLNQLEALERSLIESLPCEPNGLSLQELADGLIGNRGPAGRGRIRTALDSLSRAMGGLAIRRGDDFLGHADVELYGLPRPIFDQVRRLLGRPAALGSIGRPGPSLPPAASSARFSVDPQKPRPDPQDPAGGV